MNSEVKINLSEEELIKKANNKLKDKNTAYFDDYEYSSAENTNDKAASVDQVDAQGD